MLSQVVGVPAVIVAVALKLRLELGSYCHSLCLMSKASVYNDLMALKLVIHPSVTGTALEHDGARV